jgi:hypothetical protein
VLVGVVATLAANVASADPTATARLVALAAPVSFLLSVEVLTRTGRKLSTPDDNPTGRPAVATGRDSQPATVAAKPRGNAKTAARRRPTARQRVVKAVEQTPHASAAEIAARLKVSERTVQRYWPRPAGDTPPPAAAAGNSTGGGPVDLFSGNGLAPVPADAFTRPDRRPSPDHAEAAAS